jgi:hypothetical protein
MTKTPARTSSVLTENFNGSVNLNCEQLLYITSSHAKIIFYRQKERFLNS